MNKVFANLLSRSYVDSVFRTLNKKKLLIIAYHGICPGDNCPPLFTHLPLDIFQRQLQFLKNNYDIISLKELQRCLEEKKAFPERAALLTFDDGFMNNYEYAFPLLKKYNFPAIIFLTVDYIGTKKLLWFDEVYLLIKQALASAPYILEDIMGQKLTTYDVSDIYPLFSGKLKRLRYEECQNKISELKSRIDVDFDSVGSNFRLLGWEQVIEMKKSGLIDFGVHTANHRILSELSVDEWEKEIVEPKEKLTRILDSEIRSFCYPNGIPGKDFTGDHEAYLRSSGYLCAFSTEESLNSLNDNPFCLRRIPAGNDMTSDRNFFRLNTSGFIGTLKRLAKRK